MAAWELWSWDARNEKWLGISQGTAREMRAAAERHYASARRMNMPGAAFIASARPPTERPEVLGCEITPEVEQAGVIGTNLRALGLAPDAPDAPAARASLSDFEKAIGARTATTDDLAEIAIASAALAYRDLLNSIDGALDQLRDAGRYTPQIADEAEFRGAAHDDVVAHLEAAARALRAARAVVRDVRPDHDVTIRGGQD